MMATYRLVAKVDTEQAGASYLIRSPAVGVADGVPDKGVFLNPMRGFLTLTILNRRYLVLLPRNVQGIVTEQLIEDTATPVAYNQPLLRLGKAESVADLQASERRAEDAGADDLIAVPAPSHGVFYRRPSPDSPSYVEEGSEVTAGTVLGLVEVMKSFNQIAYGGPGLPERGTVAKIFVEDAAEVTFGQTLFLIRPG